VPLSLENGVVDEPRLADANGERQQSAIANLL
jgi:hypothetical protein